MKKDAFRWGQQAEAAFQELKTAFTQVSVLAMRNFQKTFLIETDASRAGVGAILMQEQHPIAYFSQALGT